MSAPGLGLDAILKMTNIELELISDCDMYMFFEEGTRGGISCISNRYTKPENKHLKSYDPKQKSKHVIHLTQIIYMVMQCLNFFQQVDSNG